MNRLLAIFAGIATLAALGAPAGAAPQEVEIPFGRSVLKTYVFVPDGTGPFPVVIGMHGCEGLQASGTIDARYRDWAERLGKAGIAVVYPDSYGSRDLGPQCRNRAVLVRINRERARDAQAVLAWVQDQPFARPDRVSLLGWSSGGVGVLWAIRPQAASRDERPDFRSAVALYPGCNRLELSAWSARVPTLVLIGGADDWAPARACERMVAGARGRSAHVTIVVYPGAYHDFDHPNRPVHVRSGYAFSTDGSGRVHTGTNAAARSDAIRRVTQFLTRTLGAQEHHSSDVEGLVKSSGAARPD
jgi:dienelactone hydrolase